MVLREAVRISGVCEMCRGCEKEVERGPHLGFHVVRDVVHGASEGYFTDGPRGVVGEVGGQDADPQLPLVGTCRTYLHAAKYK